MESSPLERNTLDRKRVDALPAAARSQGVPAGAAPRVQAGAAGGGRRRAPGRQPPVPCRSLPATHARAPLYKATTNFSVLQDVCCVSACVSIPKCREVTSAAAPWRRHPVPRSGNLAQRQVGASRHLGSVPVSVIVGLLAPGVDRVDLSVGPGAAPANRDYEERGVALRRLRLRTYVKFPEKMLSH